MVLERVGAAGRWWVALAAGLALSCVLFQPVQAQSVMATWLTETQSAGATPQDPPQAPQATPWALA